MEIKEFVGLDLGQKRTGIARGSSAARLAEPLESMESSHVLRALENLSKENDIAGVVVGLPRNLSGNDTAQTDWARTWVNQAKEKINLPFYWQDEALTSRQASKIQLSKYKHQKIDEHSLAAAIILQDFLDTPEAERVVC